MGNIYHEWNGTVLTITSDSGTSSADLKGATGDDGCRGAQGVPGLNGVLTVSSMTDEERKLIIDGVLEALPNGDGVSY